MDDYKTITVICEGKNSKISKIMRLKDNKYLISKEMNYSQMLEKEKQSLISEVNILRQLRSSNTVRYVDRYPLFIKDILINRAKSYILLWSIVKTEIFNKLLNNRNNLKIKFLKIKFGNL